MNPLHPITTFCLAISFSAVGNDHLAISPASPIEKLDAFFLNSKSGQVRLEINDEKYGEHRPRIPMGSKLKVHAKFEDSKPEGTYIFYIKPDTGGYDNRMIFTGYLNGVNKISGTYTYFIIPEFGQMAGKADIYVYIPGHGVGITSIEITPKR